MKTQIRPGCRGWLAAMCLLAAGCTTPIRQDYDPFAHAAHYDVPRELQKATLGGYRAEPPDLLLIEVAHNVRSAEEPIKTGDEVVVRADLEAPVDPNVTPAPGASDFRAVNGPFRVQTDGTLDLGPIYGSVKVVGMSVGDARKAIEAHIRASDPQISRVRVSLSYLDVTGRQLIAGEHLVRPDGTISLGIYGTLPVAGMTLDEITNSVTTHLSAFLNEPQVRVDVSGYNSKVFYVITDGGGHGERVDRFPYTGNETVLDAVSQVQGLSDVSSKRVWVARPSPPGCPGSQVMMVDWRGVTQDGVTTTNYQLLPGDRIYIKADSLVSLDTFIDRVTSPIERVFGTLLLGAGTVQRLQGNINNNGVNNF